jgi:hypothetical protein
LARVKVYGLRTGSSSGAEVGALAAITEGVVTPSELTRPDDDDHDATDADAAVASINKGSQVCNAMKTRYQSSSLSFVY